VRFVIEITALVADRIHTVTVKFHYYKMQHKNRQMDYDVRFISLAQFVTTTTTTTTTTVTTTTTTTAVLLLLQCPQLNIWSVLMKNVQHTTDTATKSNGGCYRTIHPTGRKLIAASICSLCIQREACTASHRTRCGKPTGGGMKYTHSDNRSTLINCY